MAAVCIIAILIVAAAFMSLGYYSGINSSKKQIKELTDKSYNDGYTQGLIHGKRKGIDEGEESTNKLLKPVIRNLEELNLNFLVLFVNNIHKLRPKYYICKYNVGTSVNPLYICQITLNKDVINFLLDKDTFDKLECPEMLYKNTCGYNGTQYCNSVLKTYIKSKWNK